MTTTREDALRRAIKDLTKERDALAADLAALRGGPVAGFVAYPVGGAFTPAAEDDVAFGYHFKESDLLDDPERALDLINCQMRRAVFDYIAKRKKGAA